MRYVFSLSSLSRGILNFYANYINGGAYKQVRIHFIYFISLIIHPKDLWQIKCTAHPIQKLTLRLHLDFSKTLDLVSSSSAW